MKNRRMTWKGRGNRNTKEMMMMEIGREESLHSCPYRVAAVATRDNDKHPAHFTPKVSTCRRLNQNHVRILFSGHVGVMFPSSPCHSHSHDTENTLLIYLSILRTTRLEYSSL